jgi:hypothetical protein
MPHRKDLLEPKHSSQAPHLARLDKFIKRFGNGGPMPTSNLCNNFIVPSPETSSVQVTAQFLRCVVLRPLISVRYR